MAVARAYVNPAVLAWARSRAGFAISDVARAASVAPEVAFAWENGDRSPTFTQARKVASRLHVPFGTLWLPQPPDEDPLPPDFRTAGDPHPQAPSIALRDEIARVRLLQAWYRDWLDERDAARLPFVASAEISHAPETVASSIDAALGGLDAIRRRHGDEDFVREITRACEHAGIVVISNGVVGHDTHRPLSIAEFRGFVLVDDLAPVVHLNRRDAPTARAFTLAHELAHVWFGQSAIDRPDGTDDPASSPSPERVRQVERACNRVAASLLMPEGAVREHASITGPASDVIGSIANAFRVSRAAAHIRLHGLGIVSEPWTPLAGAWSDDGMRPSERSGGNYYRTAVVRTGAPIMRAILDAVDSGARSVVEVTRLLGVGRDKVDGLRATLSVSLPS